MDNNTASTNTNPATAKVTLLKKAFIPLLVLVLLAIGYLFYTNQPTDEARQEESATVSEPGAEDTQREGAQLEAASAADIAIEEEGVKQHSSDSGTE